MPAVRVVNHLCTSLVPRPMIVVFGLGTRLHVRMRTKLENGVLTTDSSHRVRVLLMAFIDQGEFEAMKTLSSRRAPRSDKHQFRAKVKAST